MNCSQISTDPDIYEIVVPFPNVSTNATNCYVVRSGDESLIIDVGAPSEEGLAILQDCLAGIGVDMAKASFFLTHFHLDHAGLAGAIIPAGATLYVSETEYARTRPENASARAHLLMERLRAIGASSEEVDMAGFMQEDGSQYLSVPHDARFVSEGDVIEVGSTKLQVVDTSGHTAGHLSLYEAASKSLFGGDHMLFVISPSIDYFGEYGDGLQAYLDNLEKLQRMPLERVYCAHGEFRTDHRDRIDWLLAHHRARLEEVCGIVADHEGISGIEVIRSIGWNVPADSWEDVSLMQRAIIITQGLVMLDHLVFSGMLEAFEDAAGTVRYRLRPR